jgi:WD40 repeat protein
VLIDPRSKSELSNFEGSEFAWINATSFVRFEGFDPEAIVQLDDKKQVRSTQPLGRMEDDTNGRAFDLTGQIANEEGTKAWASYRKGPGFLEFDLKTNKIKTLLQGRSGAYAISVLTKDSNEGVLATGGADGYVRLWNLSDLALTKEFHVASADEFVTDVDLLPDGRSAVIGVMRTAKSMEDRFKFPIQVSLLDLGSGTQRKLFEVASWQAGETVFDGYILYASLDRMKLAAIESGQLIREFVVKKAIRKSMVSANNKWLAVVDQDNVLTIFEVATAREISAKPLATDEDGPMAITNDGKYVYQVLRDGTFVKWNSQSKETSKLELTRIRGMHTNVDFITLANDDQWLITAGNHGDVGIFESATGKLVCYEQSGAAVFYAEKAWVRGDRLIFTTDTGVLFDGRLVKTAPEP